MTLQEALRLARLRVRPSTADELEERLCRIVADAQARFLAQSVGGYLQPPGNA